MHKGLYPCDPFSIVGGAGNGAETITGNGIPREHPRASTSSAFSVC